MGDAIHSIERLLRDCLRVHPMTLVRLSGVLVGKSVKQFEPPACRR